MPAKQWQWVPFANSSCRDGSGTGIGVNVNPASTKLMIFLQGGGACFNQITCALNPSHFDSGSFATFAGGNFAGTIFDRSDAKNPVADWSWVFVPYCTGDVHAGDHVDAGVPGVTGNQQFVGYENMSHFLERVVPTFANATEVLLAGESAGGFGVAANYTQVARAFGSVPVQMLDDSGPFMEDPYLSTCLQEQTRSLWNLDATVLADCGAACGDGGDFYLPYAKHVMGDYPNRQFGFMDSTDDGTITRFFGFGQNNCTGFTQESAAEYDAGLMDIRGQFAGVSNFGTFYFSGTDHTSLSNSAFDTRTAGGVPLRSWVGALVDGGVSNVGP